MTNQQLAESIRAKFNIKSNLNDEQLIKRFSPTGIDQQEIDLIIRKAVTADDFLKALEKYSESN